MYLSPALLRASPGYVHTSGIIKANSRPEFWFFRSDDEVLDRAHFAQACFGLCLPRSYILDALLCNRFSFAFLFVRKLQRCPRA